MRALLLLLALSGAALAGGGEALDDGQRQELIRIVGEDVWSELPPWRQRMIETRYARLLSRPDRKPGDPERLREYLVKPERRFELPPPLHEELELFPRRDRDPAAKVALLRLRHRRLDRHLSLVPFEARREMFRRLFPEPFDPVAAREARDELEGFVAKAMAQRVRRRLGDRPKEVLPEVVRQVTGEEEQRLLEEVRRELGELRRSRVPVRRWLERSALRLQATPRQRELIRYALRPGECPLLDPSWMGERPENPLERRLWEQDFEVLARLDLLTEAGFPREMVLHLASAGSPEEFLRAVSELRGPPPKTR